LIDFAKIFHTAKASVSFWVLAWWAATTRPCNRVLNPKGWQTVAGGRFGLLAKRPPETGRRGTRTPAGVPEPKCLIHALKSELVLHES
jgi:hypothetical protein